MRVKLAVVVFLMVGCGGTGSSPPLEPAGSGYANNPEDSTGSESQSISSASSLSPTEWLSAYNAAWTVCDARVPPVPFDPLATAEQFIQSEEARQRRVAALMKRKYPELYAQSQVPAYQALLSQQRANAYEQLEEQHRIEMERMDQEFENQQAEDERRLERQQRELDRILRTYSSPNYSP